MVRLYMDVHIRRVVTEQLRLRSVDVLTAQQDSTTEWEDKALLDRASELGRVLFTHDRDFLIIGAERQRGGIDFAGIIYAPMALSIGQCVEDLELIVLASEPEEYTNQVKHLPL
jgi:hypothetical protein